MSFVTIIDLGTVRRLSNDAEHGSGIPSSESRRISESMLRTVRVIGATTIPLSTSIAESLVTTSPGRLPISGLSSHQTSPLRGKPERFTMAPQQSGQVRQPEVGTLNLETAAAQSMLGDVDRFAQP